jgi:hypothetical protein
MQTTSPWQERIREIMSSTRTILNIIEKGLDGLPIYGPKATVAAVSETLRAVQVSLYFRCYVHLSYSSPLRRSV